MSRWVDVMERSSSSADCGGDLTAGPETGKSRPKMSERTKRKREEILKVARAQFLKHGFEGASIDSIIDVVGGSKSTLYAHFGNKEALFCAVVRHTGHESETPKFQRLDGSVEEELFSFAQDRLTRVLSPLNIGMMRLVISEASRQPHIAALFFDNAPEPTYRGLHAYLTDAAGKGALHIDDIDAACDEFLGGLLLRNLLAHLFCLETQITPEEIAAKARSVTARFIKRYGADLDPS